MELYQLKGFAPVAGQGHLTRAAERLHISQPALSAQIKALEDELGVELFERHPGGMALTPAGKRLLSKAQSVIAAAQALSSEALTLRGEVAGRVRLGTTADPELVLLPQLLAAAVERFPLLEVELHHEVSGAAFEKVSDGALDAAFYYGNLTHPAVASRVLREIEFRIVAPIAWCDRVQGASFAALAKEPWILAPAISTYRVLADDLFSKHGSTPANPIEADNEAVIRSLVAGGLGLALMRDDLARTLVDADEACVWDGTQLSTTLQFLWREEQDRDSVTLALLDLVGDLWLPQPV